LPSTDLLQFSTQAVFALAFFVFWYQRRTSAALYWSIGYLCWAGCYFFSAINSGGRSSPAGTASQVLFLSSIFLVMHGLQDRARSAAFALRLRLAATIGAIIATCLLLAFSEARWPIYSVRLGLRLLLTASALFVVFRNADQFIDKVIFAVTVALTISICVIAGFLISQALGTAAPKSSMLTAINIVGNTISMVFGLTLLAAAFLDVVRPYRQAALRDPLTGLPNRRQFTAFLDKLWASGEVSRKPLSLVVLDVDHFKQFNDTYGHSAGDRCLVQIGTLLERGVRDLGNYIARFGGEEFVLLLPDCDAERARDIADSLRVKVQQLTIPHSGSAYGIVTISVGVACTLPSAYSSVTDEILFNLADRALYAAKERGRNRTEVSGE